MMKRISAFLLLLLLTGSLLLTACSSGNTDAGDGEEDE